MLFHLFWLFGLALAAPLDPPLNIDTFTNLTSTKRCSKSQDWQAYAFLIEDCYTAVQRVYIEELLRRPDESYEFFAQGTHRKTLKPWIRTPAQYTVNSCTLSIIMLNWFAPREPLPGRGPVGYELSDIATFRDIWNAARVVEKDCMLATRQPGWDVVGRKSSIGVFLWATDSAINDQITGMEANRLDNSALGLISPNMSDVAIQSTR